MLKAREMRITGMVQGVGFRWTAKRTADSLGLAGWVRNNSDGSVGLALEGEETLIDEFMARLNEAMEGRIIEISDRETRPADLRGGFAIVR